MTMQSTTCANAVIPKWGWYEDRVPPDTLEILDEVGDLEKLWCLGHSLRTRGWVGRALLVGKSGDAWTGTHRLTAAAVLGIYVPIVPITAEYDEDEAQECSTYYDRLELLLKAGDVTACSLMIAEILENRG